MAQIFRPSANTIARIVLVAIVVGPFLMIGLAYAVMRSPYTTGQDVTLRQPIPFSHKHHVGDDGIDCRYCHTSVETIGIRRSAADDDLHDLPFAALHECANAGAGARKPRAA